MKDECYEVGNRLDDSGASKAASAAWKRGCMQESWKACLVHLHDLATGHDKRVRPDTMSAMPLARLLCDKGFGMACRYLGDMQLGLYDQGARDELSAAIAYREGCNADVPAVGACGNLGIMLTSREGVENDFPQGLALLDRACHEEIKEGWCARLGAAVERAPPRLRNRARAVEAYSIDCAQGDWAACSLAGRLLLFESNSRGDSARGVSLERTACEHGYSLGCVRLGIAYSNGQGVPVDRLEAARLAKIGCDGGEVLGCLNLGTAYDSGEGVRKDPTRAELLFRDACERGSHSGCLKLGGVLERTADAMHQQAALDAFRRACDETRGVPFACIVYALHTTGRTSRAEFDHALELVDRVCSMDRTAACKEDGSDTKAWCLKAMGSACRPVSSRAR